MAAIGTLWHTAVQREKEADLLFVGDQYRRAIENFWTVPLPAGQVKRLPQSLDELLLDPRFPQTVRHLRRAYADPMTGEVEWGLLKDAQGGIAGVYSLSDAAPFKQRNFPAAYNEFADKRAYRQWQFAVAGVTVIAPTDVQADTSTEAANPQTTPTEAQTEADSNWAARAAACQRAMERDYTACTRQAMGSAELLNSCTDATSQRHKACLAGE